MIIIYIYSYIYYIEIDESIDKKICDSGIYLKDFESHLMVDDPFSIVELNTINDMKELEQILKSSNFHSQISVPNSSKNTVFMSNDIIQSSTKSNDIFSLPIYSGNGFMPILFAKAGKLLEKDILGDQLPVLTFSNVQSLSKTLGYTSPDFEVSKNYQIVLKCFIFCISRQLFCVINLLLTMKMRIVYEHIVLLYFSAKFIFSFLTIKFFYNI